MRVYERVRDYIDGHGFKRIAVAQKTGIPEMTFSAILNGKRTMYADDLRAICLALNVSPEVFIDVDCGKSTESERPIKKNNMTDIAEVVRLMDTHLREELLTTPKKLWEHTFVRHQIDRRNAGSVFTINDHIRAMVYSMLSSGIAWERVEKDIDLATGKILSVDEVFHQYDPDYLLTCDPAQLRDNVQRVGCNSQHTLAQMKALVYTNIGKLINLENLHGNIDTYYAQFIPDDGSFNDLVRQLSDPASTDKYVQMGEALVAEYLKNIGHSLAKPDRHIRRILGSNILACSEHEVVPPYDVFGIVEDIAKEMGKTAAEVDYILWSYCAKGYGNICTVANPQCNVCVAHGICNRFNSFI